MTKNESLVKRLELWDKSIAAEEMHISFARALFQKTQQEIKKEQTLTDLKELSATIQKAADIESKALENLRKLNQNKPSE